MSLDSETQTKIFIRVCAVIGLVGSPILLLLILKAPNPDHDQVGPIDMALMIGFCIFGFIFSAWLCRRELGWFQKKN